jgi:hypothetical protein
VIACSALAACRTAAVPKQVIHTPAPAVVRAPVSRAVEWPFRFSPRPQQFVVDQVAVIAGAADSATARDTVSSHAEVEFALSPLATAVNGEVHAFLIQGSGRPASAAVLVAVPFAFRAEYRAPGRQVDILAPRDTLPCSSPALAATQSLRDLWFRPPDTLRVGLSWQDSSSFVTCRDGIPLHAAVRRAFRVSGSEERDGRLLITISRSSRTAIEGAGEQFGEAVSIRGEGTGELTYELDPATGEVSSADGRSALDLTLHGRLRTQSVRQGVQIRIRRG